MKVSIIGVTGYSGIELVRILSRHPNVEICSIDTHPQKTTELSDYLPHLNYLLDLPLEAIDAEKIMDQADLVFLATPSGISKKSLKLSFKIDFPIIDLSGDFRLKAADQYEKWIKIQVLHLNLCKKLIMD